MPAPIWDQIADLIVARVKAGTYTAQVQPQHVYRPNQHWKAQSPQPFDCYVVISGFNPGVNPEIHNTQSNVIVYEVGVYVIQPEDEQTPFDTLACYLISDLVKAIAADGSWHNWDNLALNSHWESFIELKEDKSVAVCGLRINVQTRVSESDPYTSAV